MKRRLLRVLVGVIALTGLGSGLLSGTANAAQQTVKLLNWNGECLTVADAATGSVPVETNCAHAHNFVWDQSHNNFFVEGHPGACIASGDPGASLLIEPCSNGRSVAIPDDKSGVYIQFYFKNVGTFAHANGDGRPVSMITSPGDSLAVYWAPLDPSEVQ